MPRELWDGDVLPDLETHLEILGNLFQVMSKLVLCRRTVEGGIVPDGAKKRLTVVEVLAVLS